MLDIDFVAEDAALADSIGRFCAQRGAPAGDEWPNAWWRELAGLGVLALATPEGGGGAASVVAAMEQLGAANAPGPLVPTFVATQLLDATARASVIVGESIVAVTAGPLGAWLPVASTVIELNDGAAHIATVADEVETVEMVGGDVWGRATIARRSSLGPADHAVALGNAALAAYLAGAARQLLEATASYAQDRVQFRTTIGTFQAVAHPLAHSALTLQAARTLARIAADAIDRGDDDAPARAAAARLSAAKAALDTCYRAHQTFGAIGFTVEGPVAAVSAHVRQLSMLPPHQSDLRAAVLGAHRL